MSIEDIKRTWEVEAYVQDATRSDVVHWIVTLQDKIIQLERANKEWETLWKPIDELVRPLTPLGESVGDKVVELIRENVLNERQYLPLGWSVTLPEHGTLSLGSNIGLSDGKIVQLINEYHNSHVYKFLQAIVND